MSGDLDLAAMGIGLLGGLSLFLFGMGQMTDALKAVAGDGMRKLLAGATRNRFLAAFTGAFVTAIIQSSSVTTVLVVGFITAGLMTLAQSVGVIMGANVGSTITAQIVAFKVTQYAMVLIAGGFLLLFVGQQERVRKIGAMVMGLGLIFFGMDYMSEATTPLRTYEPFIALMQRMSNPLLSMLVAAAFTALVQSSSATTGIVIVLASQGFISLEVGIALAFGANVGTCVTALLAALGKPRAAVRAAAVHVIFNFGGVLLWLGFIGYLADFVRGLSPSYPELGGPDRMAAEVPRQIANAHTVFNIANTLLFIWFTGPLAWLVTRLLPDRAEPVPAAARPLYLDDSYLETPVLAVDRIQLEVGHLADLTLGVVDVTTGMAAPQQPIDLAAIEAGAADVERLGEVITDYARRLGRTELPAKSVRRLERALQLTAILGNVTDTCAINVTALAREARHRQTTASPETRARFAAVIPRIRASIADAIRASEERDCELALDVIARKDGVQEELDDLLLYLGERLRSAEADRLPAFRLESRVVEILQRLFFFARRIAKTVVPTSEDPRDLDGSEA